MNLIELFDSRDKKKRLSHIKNLVLLACADGVVAESEKEFLIRLSQKSGLSLAEFNRIIERPNSVKYSPPDNMSERIEQLYEMFLIMMADDRVLDSEILLFKLMATRFGFPPEKIDYLIPNIRNMISLGMPADLTIAAMTSRLTR